MKKGMCFLLGLSASFPLFAQEEAGGRDTGFMQTLIMIGIALVFFYFILWRPEQKRRKNLEKQRSSIKKGDRVTAMGIIGIVANLKENTVVLKMIEGAKIEGSKAAVTDVQAVGEAEEAKDAPGQS